MLEINMDMNKIASGDKVCSSNIGGGGGCGGDGGEDDEMRIT